MKISHRRHPTWNTELRYVDAEGSDRVAKGKTFDLEGRRIDLFPSGVLCAVLHRQRKCLYTWEEKFGFPPALFRVEEDGQKNRWYSRNQLMAIILIYEKMGRLKGKNRSKLTTFIRAVRAVFYTVDRPIEIRKKESNVG